MERGTKLTSLSNRSRGTVREGEPVIELGEGDILDMDEFDLGLLRAAYRRRRRSTPPPIPTH